MEINIKFNLDATELSWIWIRWLYENSNILRMPDSMKEVRRVAGDHLRNQGNYYDQGLAQCINDDMNGRLRKDRKDDDAHKFAERIAKHIGDLEGG